MCSSQNNFVVRTRPWQCEQCMKLLIHTMGIWVCISLSWLRIWYRGLVFLYNIVVGDPWSKIQAEQCVQDVLHQKPVRLESSKVRAREKAAAITFIVLGLSNRTVGASVMNRSL